MSKILIISTSLRANSNSERLAKECEKGAKSVGNDVEFISLKNKKINYCIGCSACQNIGRCVIDDDAREIAEKVKNADTLVFATPVYYYEMAGQMKTLLDRLNPLFPSDYRFRKVYMIASAAEDGSYVFEKAYTGLSGWVECFEKAKLCGILEGGGLENSNDAENDRDVLTRAYDLGKSL